MDSLEVQLQSTDPRDVVVSGPLPQQRTAPWTSVLGALFAVLAFVGCATVLAGLASPASAANGSLRHSSVKALGISNRQDPLSGYVAALPLPTHPGSQQSGQSKQVHRPQNEWKASAPPGRQPLNPVAVKEEPNASSDVKKEPLIYANVFLVKGHVTQEQSASLLMEAIPGMSAARAEEITMKAENTGLASIGRWKLELAEAYMRVLRSHGLQSQMTRMQMPEAPERVAIPDTFNPAEWGKRGGGLGEGGGLGGSGVNFGNDGSAMEREKEGKGVAVLDRPPSKGGTPGEKCSLLLFSDSQNTAAYATKVLTTHIPGMNEGFAKEVATRAWNTGQGLVGVWTCEVAEAYMDALRGNGLKADIEQN